MTYRPPVSAWHLHGTKIRADHDRRVSIFPCFDADGLVQAIVVADRPAGVIGYLRAADALVHVPLIGRPGIGTPAPINEENIAELSGLWHYDPWWVLTNPGLSDHWATPLLKKTNCVKFFTTEVERVWFAADLSQIAWARVRTGRATLKVRWTPELLSQAASDLRPPENGPAAGPGWVLDPMWSDDQPPDD